MNNRLYSFPFATAAIITTAAERSPVYRLSLFEQNTSKAVQDGELQKVQQLMLTRQLGFQKRSLCKTRSLKV